MIIREEIPDDIPAEDFMVTAAEEGAMSGWNGVMHYQPEFKDV